MEYIIEFIENYYLYITIMACILVLSLIGYLAKNYSSKDIAILNKIQTKSEEKQEEEPAEEGTGLNMQQ